jgi:hypothetical protein
MCPCKFKLKSKVVCSKYTQCAMAGEEIITTIKTPIQKGMPFGFQANSLE